MRRRDPEPDPSGLPAELAAGPLPDLWAPPDAERPRWITDAAAWRRSTARAAWVKAATAWSKENGYGTSGWRNLLPPEVLAATSARGRLRWPGWPS